MNPKLLRFGCLGFICIVQSMGCHTAQLPHEAPQTQTYTLPAHEKPLQGDPEAGLRYLLYGDFIGSGIPLAFFKNPLPKDSLLQRTGLNAYATYPYNIFTAPNGVNVLAGNCFTCHADVLNGNLVLGLGNTQANFSQDQRFQSFALNLLIKHKFKKGRPERAAFQAYGRSLKDISPFIITQHSGVNPAFRLEEAAVRHRNPKTLRQEKRAYFKMPRATFASDVPPLWHYKKKNALYYNGMGQGDATKLLMQASVLGLPDSSFARYVQKQFKDVQAWLLQLKPPVYPYPINAVLAAKGKTVFDAHCSGCHGTYGEQVSYPNEVVALDNVKTDPEYAQYFARRGGLVDWYNASWFAQSAPTSKLVAALGYVAPPLDGIWASAPYLHNGSVPSLAALLNSKTRPTVWKHTTPKIYDAQKMGWQYVLPQGKHNTSFYDTTHKSYGNGGHTYGDALRDADRDAVLEYLKTL